MNVTTQSVRDLRAGAASARTHNLHRLAALLGSVADLGRMAVDEDDREILMAGVPAVVDAACRVARDVCRSPERGCAADTADA
jgi:hypothetical protein